MSIYLITGTVTYDHLVRVVFAGFLHPYHLFFFFSHIIFDSV